jgi:hypothetical protein
MTYLSQETGTTEAARLERLQEQGRLAGRPGGTARGRRHREGRRGISCSS